MDCKRFVLLGMCVYTHLALGEFRDPTKPAFPERATVVQTPDAPHVNTLPETSSIALSGIWISGQSKRAMINGINAKPGDVILNGVEILSITNNRVTIRENNVTRTLQLHQRSYLSR